MDARFLLKIKPDHKLTYSKLPLIAEAFSARYMKNTFLNMEEEINDSPPDSIEKWKEHADKAVGLLSMHALMLSRKRPLKKSEVKEFTDRGLEDLYTPVSVPKSEYPILSWLKESDIELKVD